MRRIFRSVRDDPTSGPQPLQSPLSVPLPERCVGDHRPSHRIGRRERQSFREARLGLLGEFSRTGPLGRCQEHHREIALRPWPARVTRGRLSTLDQSPQPLANRHGTGVDQIGCCVTGCLEQNSRSYTTPDRSRRESGRDDHDSPRARLGGRQDTPVRSSVRVRRRGHRKEDAPPDTEVQRSRELEEVPNGLRCRRQEHRGRRPQRPRKPTPAAAITATATATATVRRIKHLPIFHREVYRVA